MSFIRSTVSIFEKRIIKKRSTTFLNVFLILDKGVIDVHIAGGIDMGNITNMVKGIPEDELFGNCAPENSSEKKGIEAPERTFLNKKKTKRSDQQVA